MNESKGTKSTRNRWRAVAFGVALLFIMASMLPSRALPPKSLGLMGDRLPELPNSPNAVSSQTEKQTGKMEPFAWQGTQAEAMQKIREVVEQLPRTEVVTQTDSYLHAKFKSRLLGFIDDVEFYVPDDGQLIHFRSASRTGFSDLGVNRKRMEQIGLLLEQ